MVILHLCLFFLHFVLPYSILRNLLSHLKSVNINKTTCTYLYTSHSLSRSFLLMRLWGTFFTAAQVSLYFSLYTFPKQPCAIVLVEYAMRATLGQLEKHVEAQSKQCNYRGRLNSRITLVPVLNASLVKTIILIYCE